MTRVKDMPRNQQKAVFARMTDDNYLSRLEGAEKAGARRAYLIKRNELSETYEDKIFNVYNNSKLTHRQKMNRIAGLKKEAKGKLSKYQTENSESIVGEIREDNLRKFKKQYDIKEVPVSKTRLGKIADAPIKEVIEKRITLEKRNELAAREKIREGVSDLQKGIFAIGKATPKESQKAVRSTREANRKINQGRKELVISLSNRRQLQRALEESKNLKKKEFSKNPIVREQQIKAIEKEINAGLSYSQLRKKGINLPKKGDADKDGVKNSKDCRPLNRKKHVLGAIAVGVAASFAGARLSRAVDKDKERKVLRNNNRPEKLYKDAYKTKEEAQGVAAYLKTTGKTNIQISKDKGQDWNIWYDN